MRTAEAEIRLWSHNRKKQKVNNSCPRSAGIVDKDFLPIDAAADDVVQRARGVDEGFAWHGGKLSWEGKNIK
jgi:hypothetical protein